MSYQKIDFKQAKEIMDKYPDLMILDVREEEEYITGHAVDAILFTLAQIDEDFAMDLIPSKQTPLMVYCKSGTRSFKAALKLEELGYENVYDVGSLTGWPYGIE